MKKGEPGRPTKYKKEYDEQAYELCLLFGATNEQLAEYFNVNVDSIYEWQKVHPSFSESLKRGKVIADVEVVKTLFKRATGYEYKEVKNEYEGPEAAEEDTPTKKTVTTKQMAPDVGAIAFWLKNRRGAQWNDRISHELEVVRPILEGGKELPKDD